MISEVLVPVFGHVVGFENTLGRWHPWIDRVEVKILVPVLSVAGCEKFSEAGMWVKGARVTNQKVFEQLPPSMQVNNTLEIPCGRSSVGIFYACFAGRCGG